LILRFEKKTEQHEIFGVTLVFFTKNLDIRKIAEPFIVLICTKEAF
jgi:hypothetical protein